LRGVAWSKIQCGVLCSSCPSPGVGAQARMAQGPTLPSPGMMHPATEIATGVEGAEAAAGAEDEQGQRWREGTAKGPTSMQAQAWMRPRCTSSRKNRSFPVCVWSVFGGACVGVTILTPCVPLRMHTRIPPPAFVAGQGPGDAARVHRCYHRAAHTPGAKDQGEERLHVEGPASSPPLRWPIP